MLDLAIVAVADTVLDAQPFARIEVVHGLVEHHAQRARHRAVSSIGGDVDEFNVFG
jgi:hypothetical protein